MGRKTRTNDPRPTMASIDELITKYANQIVSLVSAKLPSAGHEDEIRVEASKGIDAFIEEARLAVKSRHEYGLAGGRINSKYGLVAIEYKNPNGPKKLSSSARGAGNREVIDQLAKRFTDFEEHEGLSRDRIFGVGTDGRLIIFCWDRGGTFTSTEAAPFDATQVERLLRAIVSVGARGSSFTPLSLTNDFGSASTSAKKGIALLYNALAATRSDRAKTFFDQWRLLFGEVCGYDLGRSNDKIKKLGQTYDISDAKAAPLLFSIHTYYAIFMKLLAAEICASFSPLPLSIISKCKAAPTDEALKAEFEALETGGIWTQLGVSNFLEGDIFSWYLSAWNNMISQTIREMVDKFHEYDPATLSVDPSESRDLLKHLYQDLIPKSVRHDLGEYYTPDWLAEYVLDASGYDGNPDLRVLDPACGSGTFLVVIIRKIREWFEVSRHSCGFGEAGLLQKILANVVGFDLNPLAVMASRVNVLLSLRDLFKYGAALSIPVFLSNSILTPASHGSLFTGKLGSVKQLKTSIGEINIPAEVSDNSAVLSKYTELLERAVKQGYRWDSFRGLLRAEGISITDQVAHKTIFDQLTTLHASGKDGIWARIIRNAFAPVFLEPVDFIIGNPPWINWESLPGEYREDLKPTWTRYGLFSLDAVGGSMGGGKKDLSMLFVFLGVDKYLKPRGTIAFVITQAIFKTSGAGDGFRSLRYDDFSEPGNTKRFYIKPLHVADLSRIQVFDGATNRTAVFVAEKQPKPFSYPVPYEIWSGPSRVSQNLSRPEVEKLVRKLDVSAAPVLDQKRTSPWLTVPKAALPGLKKMTGNSDYQGRAGCTTWMNGVFWVEALKVGPRVSLIRNLHDVGKTKGIKQLTASVDSALLYPLLRGRDVSRWSAFPSCHIVLTQDPATRSPIPRVGHENYVLKNLFVSVRIQREAKDALGLQALLR